MMTNHFIDIQGVRIAYAEANADKKPTIFFFHGNSSSYGTWRALMEFPGLREFRMVAVDLPAHGLSEAAAEQTMGYSLPGIALFLSGVVKILSEGRAPVLAGVSLGATIIAEMLPYIDPPSGLFFVGPFLAGNELPMSLSVKPDSRAGLSFVDAFTEEDMADWSRMVAHSLDDTQALAVREDVLRVKDGFRSKLGESVSGGQIGEHLSLITHTASPVRVIMGEEDVAFFPNYLDNTGLASGRNKVVKLGGAGHWAHLDVPFTVADLLGDFARDVFNVPRG